MKPFKPVLLVLLIVPAFVGCKLATLLAPDPRPLVSAQFKLSKAKKTAVLIDDYMAPIQSPELKAELAQKVAANLTEGGALRAGDLIGSDKVNDVSKESDEGKKNSIQRIGRDLGADIVVYVNVVDFNLQSDPDNPLIQPQARAYVKVVDVASGERLWPIDITGQPVQATTRMEGDLASDTSAKAQATEKIIDKLAAQVAELFFEHRED